MESRYVVDKLEERRVGEQIKITTRNSIMETFKDVAECCSSIGCGNIIKSCVCSIAIESKYVRLD